MGSSTCGVAGVLAAQAALASPGPCGVAGLNGVGVCGWLCGARCAGVCSCGGCVACSCRPGAEAGCQLREGPECLQLELHSWGNFRVVCTCLCVLSGNVLLMHPAACGRGTAGPSPYLWASKCARVGTCGVGIVVCALISTPKAAAGACDSHGRSVCVEHNSRLLWYCDFVCWLMHATN